MMDSFGLWLGIISVMLLLVALSLMAGAMWTRRRAQRELTDVLLRARTEQESALIRCESKMKVEVAALEAKMVEERKRAAKEFAAIENRRQQEVVRWQRIALGPAAGRMAPPDYPDRPSARDLEAVLSRLRGFAFIDGVAIADGLGLLLCSDETESGRDLATLAPSCADLRRSLPGSSSRSLAINLVSEEGRYVALRPLPSWTQGAWLIALSSGQPPSPLALDAALGVAMLREETPQRPPVPYAFQSTTGTFGDDSLYGQKLLIEMEALLGLTGSRAVCVCHKGQLAASIVQSGPSTSECGQLCQALEQFRVQAAWQLRSMDLTRIDLILEEGLTLTYAPLCAGSQIGVLMVSEGHVPGPVHLMALAGRIRRLLANIPSVALGPEVKLSLPSKAPAESSALRYEDPFVS